MALRRQNSDKRLKLMDWFTADTHFNHTNILSHCDRPFESVLEMNSAIIDNINHVVGTKDILWHLGDVSWIDPWLFLKKINCKRIRILPGNHDKKNKKVFKELKILDKKKLITLLPELVDIRIDKRKVTLCHYSMNRWNSSSHGAYHLFGHSHGNFKDPEPNSMDVGVDPNNFKPISFEQIAKIFDDQPTVPLY
jgi:calcineurin-like phosphoesterase family protein